MQINILLKMDKIDHAPPCHSTDVDHLDETTFESLAETVIGTCPVRKTSSGNLQTNDYKYILVSQTLLVENGKSNITWLKLILLW